ncbi:hypothetical protein SAMN05216573_12285 [Bradyrhizobium sp. Rc3b]|nr:hypothetical protein SAMN05216573_12285 [Bradyrhizobium sp. Rc3b]
MASFESWMRRIHLNLPGLTFLPQDLFPEFGLGNDRRNDSATWPGQPVPITAIASRVKADGCLLTLKGRYIHDR